MSIIFGPDAGIRRSCASRSRMVTAIGKTSLVSVLLNSTDRAAGLDSVPPPPAHTQRLNPTGRLGSGKPHSDRIQLILLGKPAKQKSSPKRLALPRLRNRLEKPFRRAGRPAGAGRRRAGRRKGFGPSHPRSRPSGRGGLPTSSAPPTGEPTWPSSAPAPIPSGRRGPRPRDRDGPRSPSSASAPAPERCLAWP